MEKIRDIFTENLRELRESRRWTQAEAAQACRMPFPTYRNFEYGKTWPREEQIALLAKGFGVDESVLFSAAIQDAGFLSPIPAEIREILEGIYSRRDAAQIRALEAVIEGFATEREREALTQLREKLARESDHGKKKLS